MLSLRSIGRAAPRGLPRASISASVAGITLRQPRTQRSSLLVSPAAITARLPLIASPFSTTSAACKKSGRPEPKDASNQLVSKIESEIQFEEEATEKDQLPSSIKDWLENSEYILHDAPGEQSVKLTRDYKGEKITVRFSISGIDSFNDLYNEDMDDEGLDEEGLNTNNDDSPANRQRGTPSRPAVEDDVAEDDDLLDNELEDEDVTTPPLHISIVIEKPGRAAGALAVDATCEHGSLVVDNMAYYPDVDVARGETSEAQAAQHKQYSGPPFASLDEDLQNVVDSFLHERGISAAMAIFATDYVDVKEQREYIRWLNEVKKFVSA